MSVEIGINPLTWTNDDLPSLGGDTPLQTCLAEGKAAGYTGFELGHKFPRQSAELSKELAPHDLKLVSGWYSSFLLSRSLEEEKAAIDEHLTLLSEMGCKVMVLCELTDFVHGNQSVPFSMRKPFPAERWAEFGEKLSQLAAYTFQQGVQIAYHHHMGTVIQTAAEVDELMKHTSEEVGLLLDTGHMTVAGDDPVAVAKKWASRIVHVHCKDIRAEVLLEVKNRNLSFLDAVLMGLFTVPGDGCIDYPAVLKVLKEADYQGWLVVEAEQDPAIAIPTVYAQLGHKNLYKLASDAGLLTV